MSERPWRTVQHDLLGAVRCMPFDEDAGQNALRPGAVRDPFDFGLTRGESPVAIVRVQDESAEVAETVEGKTHHLAGECPALLFRLANDLPRPVAAQGRRDTVGIATDAAQPSCDEFDVAQQDRIPG